MPEIIVWIMAGIVAVGSLVAMCWPVKRYENVTRNRAEKP
jgi:hypothetical protein